LLLLLLEFSSIFRLSSNSNAITELDRDFCEYDLLIFTVLFNFNLACDVDLDFFTSECL
jgi:hypothetical protein